MMLGSSKCGEASLPQNIAAQLRGTSSLILGSLVLKAGSCMENGFTVQRGEQSLSVPVLGRFHLSLYSRPEATLPADDVNLKDEEDDLNNDESKRTLPHAPTQPNCLQKEDGWWCEQGDGSWRNENTGQIWSQAAKGETPDENGCYQKYDGLWCPDADGSWVNDSTGARASKADVARCVQKEDGLWCPHGWHQWINMDTGSTWVMDKHAYATWAILGGLMRVGLWLSLIMCLCYACTRRGKRSSRNLVVWIDTNFTNRKRYQMQVDAPPKEAAGVVQGEAMCPPPTYDEAAHDADLEKAITASLAGAAAPSAPPTYA
jgi:hypothetical protein